MAQKMTQEQASAAHDSKIRIVELMVAHLLRAGVVASFVTVGVGIVLLVVTGKTGYGTFDIVHVQNIIRYQGDHPHFPISLRDVWDGVSVAKPYAFISLGLLILILTPVMRVVVTVVAFVIERDWQYVLITGFVFCMLLLSFLLGKAV